MPSRTRASLFALGLALIANIASSSLDWEREAEDSSGLMVVVDGSPRSFAIWVGGSEDTLEGVTRLSIEAETAAVAGQPLLMATLGWQGAAPESVFAESWQGGDLSFEGSSLLSRSDILGTCDQANAGGVPPSSWEDELCWVELWLDLEAIEGDVSLNLVVSARVEGHGTQGNLIPHPELVVMLEELE